MKKVGHLCEDCLKSGIVTPAEEVHHIIELTPENINDPNISLNEENLVALCREHHRRRHSKAKRRWMVDDEGKVSPL